LSSFAEIFGAKAEEGGRNMGYEVDPKDVEKVD
jgi:hypothetical protein